MRLPKLTEEEIQEHLTHLPDWTRAGESITRLYELKDFVQALQFVNQVAEAAEAVNPHPDIDIRYSKVTLLLTTHDSGGLTKNDVELAASCDELYNSVPV